MVLTSNGEENDMAEISAELFSEYVKARADAKAAKTYFDALAEQVKARAGKDVELTVDGTKVGTYERIKKFAAKSFIKARPELAEEFTVHKYVEEIDERKLARLLPDVYAEFQVRQLNIEG
jgi:hypothetical protein